MRSADYGGTCAECEGPVHVGDMIENRQGEWVHVACPDPLGALAPSPGEKICTVCGMIHRGEC